MDYAYLVVLEMKESRLMEKNDGSRMTWRIGGLLWLTEAYARTISIFGGVVRSFHC